MTTKNDGGPAFPGGVNEVYTNIEKGDPTQSGMTLRDYFAARAMQGLLARGIHYQTEGSRSFKSGLEECDIAGLAYEMAGAMLAARDAA